MPEFADLRPKLRDAITFSPRELRDGKAVYYAKDNYTEWFYRIGEREHFIFTRLDGRTSLSSISRDYEARFGAPLNERSWEGLFDLLGQRQMLEGEASAEKLDELRERVKTEKAGERKWLQHKFHLVNPDAVLGSLLPWTRFMFRPAVVLLGIALIVLTEALVLLNFHQLSASSVAGRGQVHIWPLFFGFLLAATLLHEMAHGLACKHYGGRVTDMGVLWRYLWFYPYCNIDYIILFNNRRHRVYVAFAGTYVSLLLLAPAALVWSFSTPGETLYALSAKILIWFNFMALLNLIPFVQLDGYLMLSQALGMHELRRESHAYVKQTLRRLLRRPGAAEDVPPPRRKRIYLAYGVASVLATGALLALMLSFWYRMVGDRFANSRGAVLWVFILMIASRFGVTWGRKWYRDWRARSELPTLEADGAARE